MILDSDRSGAQSVDIRKGSCKSYAETPGAPLVAVSGSDQQTKLWGAKLESPVGSVLLVHKAQDHRIAGPSAARRSAAKPLFTAAGLRGDQLRERRASTFPPLSVTPTRLPRTSTSV